MCYLVADSGLTVLIRLLLDNASNVTLLQRECADQAGLEGQIIDLDLGVSGGQILRYKGQKQVRFKLQSICGTFQTDYYIEASTINKVSAGFDRITVDPKKFAHLKNITDFTEPYPMSPRCYKKTNTIQLLLGQPYETMIRKWPFYLRGEKVSDPKAICTHLGTCLSADSRGENKSRSFFTTYTTSEVGRALMEQLCS